MVFGPTRAYPMMWYVDSATERRLFAIARPLRRPRRERTRLQRFQHKIKKLNWAFWQRNSYFVGLLWLLSWPAVSVTTGELKARSTYFDETSLAPMAARSTVSDFHLEGRGRGCDALATLRTPPTVSECSTVDGAAWIVVSPRSGAVSMEALALIAVDRESTAFVLAYARHAAEAGWLAKNLVIVLAENRTAVGCFTRAYLDEKTCQSGMLPPGDYHRGGSLRGALLFESSDNNAYIRVLTHGSNNELPNLDFAHLINVALTGIDARIDNCPFATCADYGQGYLSDLRGLAMWTLAAAAGPSGAHAMLIGRSVDSATLVVNFASFDVALLAARVELVLRSMNTVEHELHHSAFMYLLASPWTFVSIDEYAGAVILMNLPLGMFGYGQLVDMASYVGLETLSIYAISHSFYVLGLPLLAGYGFYHARECPTGVLYLLYALWFAVCASYYRSRQLSWRLARTVVQLYLAYTVSHLLLANAPFSFAAVLVGTPLFGTLRPPSCSGRREFYLRALVWVLTCPLTVFHLRSRLLTRLEQYDDFSLWYLAFNWTPLHLAVGCITFFDAREHEDLYDEVPLGKKWWRYVKKHVPDNKNSGDND